MLLVLAPGPRAAAQRVDPRGVALLLLQGQGHYGGEILGADGAAIPVLEGCIRADPKRTFSY